MSLDSWSFGVVTGGCILLLFASYYYTTKRDLWEGKIGLVLISFVQGLILGVLYNVDNAFVLFATTVVFGVLYYLFFSKLVVLFEFLKNRLLKTFVAYENNELTETMVKLSGLSTGKINISIYSGNNSRNAFTALSIGTVKIFVGEKLLAELTKNEMIFVLSHEIAHQKNKRFIAIFALFPLVYLIFCGVFIIVITSLGLLSVPLYFILSIIFYILGIIILNKVSWLNEYSADRDGLLMSKDYGSAESMLTKFLLTQKDHGFLNLVFYDHPPLSSRIENLKKINIS